MKDSSSQYAGGVIAAAAVVITGSALFTGLVGGGLIQQVVQTAPLWLLMVFGWRGGACARWAGAPLLGFWTVIAALIWADHMGWTHLAGESFAILNGPVATIVAAAGVIGLAACGARQERISPLTGLTLALACGALQIGAFYLGMQSGLAGI